MVTAKTFPIDSETGAFQSEPAEFAHQVAAQYSLSRTETRCIIQAFVVKMDECDAKYKAWVEAGRPR